MIDRTVIFLDIDGVLCTTKAHVAQRGEHTWGGGYMGALDRESCGLLAALQEKCPLLYFVCSSTWRKYWEKDELADHIAQFGFTPRWHDDWKTTSGLDGRGGEIQDWLDRNGITNYAIIDDVDAPNQFTDEQRGRFIHTDEDDGFSYKDYRKLCALLGVK